ncbi:DUF3445 domain-containing protein [Labrenzia sp. PHM005]|uniref:heme-dependent oxidative N-demethylase family protein n=1 Tax=Labrenzia sp. PHM005 TaxID=2590016 RepID=UPI0011402BD6|nr:DUF3445 domain-containing protein [Labrenzia sp. PHM005]QDG75695.1 DUF3445 domain-containing protein [Labrenzia sp. PHM005]
MHKPAPPFQHTPYDGTSLPFTMGLKPITEETWLEPDPFLEKHLAEKDRLLEADRDAVFRAEDGTRNAQYEILTLIVENLQRHHGATYSIRKNQGIIKSTGRTVDLDDEPALLTAARLVQEDLVLMRPGPDGYRLAAACLCFPSSWSLAEKFGQSMSGIHKPVPGFNGHRMGMMVARLFDNLKAGQYVCRFNWSIYPDGELHHPEAKQIDIDNDEAALPRLFLRVERQTLRRLPKSGDVLFTIKIHHDPLTALQNQPNRAALAAHLKDQLMGLDLDQLAYKGLTRGREALVEALAEIAAEVEGAL